MATSTIQRGNKSKKQGSSNNGKYVYSMGGPGSKPEPPPPKSIKKVIPTNNPRGLMGLGSLIRSKTYRERTIHEVKKDCTHVAKVEETMAVKSRKSVACEKSRSSVSEAEIMAAKSRKSVSELSGRSSVSELMSVKVLVSDMPGFMQVHAFRCARASYDGLETFSAKHIAFNIKKEFDKVYGPAWHCIVGSSFGSFVTHSTGGFLYFSMENLYILVFKTKVQKALHYS